MKWGNTPLRRKIENTICLYMMIFLPTLFSIGRFIPVAETLATFLCILVLVLEQGLKRKHFCKYIVIVCLFAASGFIYPKTDSHIAHIKCLIIMFLGMDAVYSGLYDRIRMIIRRYGSFITGQLMAIMLANLVFIFTSAGYSNKYSELWSLAAYQGIYSDPHQCAYHLCALLVILLLVSQADYRKFHWLILAGFEYCTFITGARVPTVLAVFIGLIYVLDHVPRTVGENNMRNLLLKGSVIILIAVGVLYFIIRYTTFGVKMLESIASENIDSGRSNLRERDLLLFGQSDLLHMLLGHGTDGVINYHGSFAYATYIWSHNDFMQMLCGMGLPMLCIYCWEWYKLLRTAVNESMLSVLMVVLLIGVAFFNGLYIHPRLVFVMPLLLFYMGERSMEKVEVAHA